MKPILAALVGLTLSVGLSGCGARHNIDVSWYFSSARTCAEAGVGKVTVATMGGSLLCEGQTNCQVPCTAGSGETLFTIEADESVTEVDVSAQSPSGQTIYVGSAPVDQNTNSVMITLQYRSPG